MTLEQAQDVLTRVVDRDPGVLFDILSHSAPPGRNAPTENQPPWCRCAHCREMPTDIEKKCCLHPPEHCISTVPHVETYIIQKGVLRLARQLWNELRAMVDGPDHGEDNRQFRHAAYRQYVAWRHGSLGAGRRVVIPSCVVWKIRDTFPDPNEHYTGFIPRRL
uniref:P2X purinoreceptor 7 intracellular domain-containing protein n=1 Tax=Neogobius melanostomus TaxID=47308 RepID=A0A8C6U9R1_9GOBI